MSEATYSLEFFKQLVKEGNYRITQSSLDTAFEDFGYSTSDVVKIALELRAEDFYKTMEAAGIEGAWQDVYRPTVEDKEAYVKIQVLMGQQARIISFKLK